MPYRGNLTYRLVELQLMLAERPRSQQELVQYFQVNRKTIRKDIDALSGHHPITEERAGRHVMYRFIDGFRFQPPQFTPSELATLLLAQEAIAITGQNTATSPFAVHARTLMGKVRAALPEYARRRLDILAHVFGSAATPVKDFTSLRIWSRITSRIPYAVVSLPYSVAERSFSLLDRVKMFVKPMP